MIIIVYISIITIVIILNKKNGDNRLAIPTYTSSNRYYFPTFKTKQLSPPLALFT